MVLNPKILVIGDLVIDYYPESGSYYAGGSAVNTALALQDNGAAVDLLVVVGNDELGKQLVHKLEARDIGTEKLIWKQGRTARAAWKRQQGNVELITVDKGVDSGISREYLSYDSLTDYDLIHTTPYSLTLAEIKFLAENYRLSLDASFVFTWEELAQIIENLCFLFVSPGKEINFTWELLRQKKPQVGCVLLQAEKGAEYYPRTGEQLKVEPVNKHQPYDDLGAGDAFIGNLLAHYLQAEKVDMQLMINLLKRAAEAAAKICQHEGATGLKLA
ncbi:MAG: PfkB family carbohydrate kinase [Bacillota bacterium]